MNSISLVMLAFAGDWETVEARLNDDPGLELLNELFESNSDYHTKYLGSHLLHFAALDDRVQIIRQLLAHGVDADLPREDGRTALMLAVAANNIESVRTLHAAGASVTVADELGYSAIHCLPERRFIPMLRCLIELGVDVNARTLQGKTLMHRLGDQIVHTCLSDLLSAGLDVNAQAEDGSTLLNSFVSTSSIGAVQSLLKHGADPTIGNTQQMLVKLAQRKDVALFTLLEQAAASLHDVAPRSETAPATEAGGETDTAPATEAGGETDTAPATEAGGETDTAPATEAGSETDTAPATEAGGNAESNDSIGLLIADHEAICEALMQGFDPEQHLLMLRLLKRGGLRLHEALVLEHAISRNWVEVVKECLGSCELTLRNTLAAIRGGNLEMLQLLKEHSCPVDSAGERTDGPFNVVRDPALVPILVEMGADIDHVGTGGSTPVIAAETSNNLELLTALLEGGADPNKHDAHGVTAMVKAAYEGRASHLRCLYKHGGDPTLGNSRGMTPLHWACARNHIECVDFLLEEVSPKVDVSKPSDTDVPPIVETCFYGHYRCVEALLKHGASPDESNDYYVSCVHWVCRKNFPDVLQLLLDAGAKVNVTSKENGYPINMVTKHKNEQCGKILLSHPVLGPTVDCTILHDGQTAVHDAAQAGMHELLALMLKQSNVCPSTLLNAHGETPLQRLPAPFPQTAGVEKSAQLLVDAGAQLLFVLSSGRPQWWGSCLTEGWNTDKLEEQLSKWPSVRRGASRDIRLLLLHMRTHNVHSAPKTSSAVAATPDDTATTTQEGAATTTQEGAAPTTQEGAATTTQEGAATTTQEGADTTTQEGADTTTQEGADTTTQEGSSTSAQAGPPQGQLLTALLNRRQTSVGTFARVCRMMWCCSPDQRVTHGLLDAAVESGVSTSGNATESGSSQELLESEVEGASPATPTPSRRILRGRRRLQGNQRG